MMMKINNNIISVRLGFAYFAEIENFLLKILLIKVKVSWNSIVKLMNSTKKCSGAMNSRKISWIVK